MTLFRSMELNDSQGRGRGTAPVDGRVLSTGRRPQPPPVVSANARPPTSPSAINHEPAADDEDIRRTSVVRSSSPQWSSPQSGHVRKTAARQFSRQAREVAAGRPLDKDYGCPAGQPGQISRPDFGDGSELLPRCGSPRDELPGVVRLRPFEGAVRGLGPLPPLSAVRRASSVTDVAYVFRDYNLAIILI